MTDVAIEILKYLIFPGAFFILLWTVFLSWWDRKAYAKMQNRIGPPLLWIPQPLLDVIKLLAKEDITPDEVDKYGFILAPVGLLLVALTTAFFVPVYHNWGIVYFEGDVFVLIFLLAIFGALVLLMGWFSNNPYSLVGGGRAAAQELAFEIPLGLAFVGPIILTGKFRISEISATMYERVIDYPASLIPLAILFGIALLSVTALLEKVPFDTPLDEMSIVGGWTAEYSGRKYGFITLAELVLEFSLAGILAALFFGGIPIEFVEEMDKEAIYVVSTVLFLIKTIIIVLLIAMIRGLHGRVRIDQMMTMFWRWLVPLSLICVVTIMGIVTYM
ncbi:MAG: complex I subunit 1/NuoH family protein [Candidatus Hodarchaeales archaeon]|jgi:NADH-quinone oxidoreductase subunit H